MPSPPHEFQKSDRVVEHLWSILLGSRRNSYTRRRLLRRRTYKTKEKRTNGSGTPLTVHLRSKAHHVDGSMEFTLDYGQ